MKRRLWICMTLICFSLVLFFPSCGKDKKKNNVQQIAPPKSEISLDNADIRMLLGDQTYIVPSYETVAGQKVVFKSSNEGVATVDENGLVEALGLGETTLTVTYGDKTTEAKIKVESGSYLPSLHLNHLTGDTITVSMVDRANLTAYVNFNGKRFEDGAFAYELDGQYGSVKDGFFTPAKEGETTLTVQGSWRGFSGVTLQKTFKLKIVNAFEFYVNDGSFSYTTHNKESVGTDYYGKTEIPFNVYCYENGRAVENVTVTVTEGADVIAYDSETKTLKVLDEKVGQATVEVKATDGKGGTYTLTLKITVKQSSPPEAGYFNPDWIVEKDDFGYFNPDWVTE